ncbi:MAG: PAS domain-containing protein [Nibricoccus sp.]
MAISRIRRSRLLLPVLVLVGLLASGAGYKMAISSNQASFAAQLNKRANARADQVVAAVERCRDQLDSFADLIAANPDITQDGFGIFAQRVMSRHPALAALVWAKIDGANARIYSQETAPSTDKATLSVNNLAGIQPEIQRALSSRRTVLTGNLTPASGSSYIGIVHPIEPVGVQSNEKLHASGCLVVICSVEKLLAGEMTSDPLNGRWLLIDHSATAPSRRVLFQVNEKNRQITPAADRTSEESVMASLHSEAFITTGDRNWLLQFQPTPEEVEAAKGNGPLWVLVAGVAITLLVTVLMREFLHREELIKKQVEQRTSELQITQGQLEEDIRRRQQTEELLRASEQHLQSLMENSPGAIYVKDVDGRYLAVNRRFTELHGRSRDDFIGRSDFDLFPPDLAARVRKSDAQVMAGAEPLEMEESFQLIDGTHVNLVHKFPLLDATGAVHGVCAISTDITERKRAEAEVRESRRQLESILGQLPGMAFRYANDGRLSPVYVSRGAAGLTGHTARDFLEKHISLEEVIHPDDRQRVRAAIAAAVKKRRSFEIEYRLIDRAGREKWVLERGQGLHDETGALLFIEGLAIDITQRKDAEAEKLLVERRLLEGQKLESIGMLAGGIAHDFNNLLTGIIGNANLASLDLPSQSPIRNNLRQIETASQRAAELCQQMLAYAGKGRFVIHPVELGQLVRSTLPLLQASISKRAKLNFDLQPDLPAVMSDPTQMRQIIMNLVINASEALGDKDGEIAITTNLVQPAADWFEGAPLAPPDPNIDFVRLEVRDTGCGMSPETIAKIFEPFFTTKFTGRGLGLSAVLGIIRSHRGGLIVRSVVGKGTIFAVFFPAEAVRKTEATITRAVTNTPWQQTGRVLVVDDEPHVLKVASGMLTNAGMTVVGANDGYEALDVFRADPSGFKLVLLDMTMPRLSGEETLHLLREIRPDVRVLFMSGYNRREVIDTLPGRHHLGFMQKPFTLQNLRESVQLMLS